MTEILQSPSHQLPSSPSSIPCISSTLNDGLHQQTHLNHDTLFNCPTSYPVAVYRGDTEEGGGGRERKEREKEEGDQLSLLALFETVFRKSLIPCRSERVEEFSSSMEIGWPTNVRHVAHVTFDRFNGFLGLPVEFEPEVPRRPPSASATVFGVSTESMQLSFDTRGNSVPTILLMMQRRLYAQGGLQAEGIFRINPENGQEEYVREQLNRGVVPDNIDMHCLAGLIKAWFRELPNGLLDTLSSEQVMEAQSEEECARLVRLLPPTEAALMDWAINLMADVAQLEYLNKMNARNIAMVFAPNMTQMADPLTALMYAVQVMNFLKTLIVKTLRDREDSIVERGPESPLEPSDENGHQYHSSWQPFSEETNEVNEEGLVFVAKEPFSESTAHPIYDDSKTESETHGFLISIENIIPEGSEVPNQVDTSRTNGLEEGGSNGGTRANVCKTKKGFKKANERTVVRGSSIASRINSRTERIEAWR
uniref:Rho GTPase-activating protein 1 n=1 Tax=Davidia involucrata TaxID=16924 RepID=A0A5B6YM41_DAVIN